VQAVAGLQGDEARREAEAAVAAEAADRPAEVRRALTAYLTQVPGAVRRSQRRPADPSGRTLTHGLSLRQPADVLPFLPPGLPRFKPGDRRPADWRDVLAERGVPEGALQLLGACLASRAEKRPADAGAVADGLAAVLEADPPYAELADPVPAARPAPSARPGKGRPAFWKAQPVPAEEPPEVLPATDGMAWVRVPRVDVQGKQLFTDLGPDEVFAALYEAFLQYGVQGVLADRSRRTVAGATGLDVRSFGQYVQGQVVASGRQTVATVSSNPQRQLFDWGRGDQEARAIIQMLARRLTSPARRRDSV
jgi:hypothetical protein